MGELTGSLYFLLWGVTVLRSGWGVSWADKWLILPMINPWEEEVESL